ncbi:LysR family transcriptional regulator [Calycomorphotria hydatis]|uniref:HTH-type transcriptional activator CmpR n=1 Tax=Calycomorphotria hydatis TaxID=2528027 RepID=A0A517TCB1_9PLAN|nr:LysR family transcriptional regulator [Calycomorphotria hydatis]QDT66014.1 HTH-type transcriptional activator CmpR [Calycomorphotria hydatis]
MHLKDVEIFCEVAARRSFSKAAEAHRLSQSTASHAVGMLEKRLGGVQLIDRSKRPLELTAAGEIFHAGCRNLLANFRSVEDEVQRVANRVSGRLCVTSIYSAGLSRMEEAIAAFQQSYPEVEFRLEYRDPNGVYDGILSEEAHLGVVSFPREGGEFTCIPWVEQEMGVAVHPEHEFAREGQIDVIQLDGQRLIALSRSLMARRQMERWLRESHVHLEISREFDNIEAIKRSVEVGTGIAILPLETFRREVEIGTLSAITINDVEWLRPLGFVHKRHKTLSVAAKKFIELLQSDRYTGKSTESPNAVGVGAPK